MKKYVIVIVFIVVASAISVVFFSKSERKARFVHSNMRLVHTGMNRDDVTRIIGEPDTVYQFKHKDMYGDSVIVLQYYLGFAAPDVLRVFTREDSVIDVVSFD
jgi:hypothetical protein